MKRLALLASTAILLGVATAAWAGGELPEPRAKAPAAPRWSDPAPVAPGSTIPKSKIGPPLGAHVPRNAPLPPPERRVGWGMQCYDAYGPTYHYPYTHNVYEGLNPTYYPHYQPRLWPNYKSPGVYHQAGNRGSGRSWGYWDDYDDWTRGGRYEEKQ